MFHLSEGQMYFEMADCHVQFGDFRKFHKHLDKSNHSEYFQYFLPSVLLLLAKFYNTFKQDVQVCFQTC